MYPNIHTSKFFHQYPHFPYLQSPTILIPTLITPFPPYHSFHLHHPTINNTISSIFVIQKSSPYLSLKDENVLLWPLLLLLLLPSRPTLSLCHFLIFPFKQISENGRRKRRPILKQFHFLFNFIFHHSCFLSFPYFTPSLSSFFI